MKSGEILVNAYIPLFFKHCIKTNLMGEFTKNETTDSGVYLHTRPIH